MRNLPIHHVVRNVVANRVFNGFFPHHTTFSMRKIPVTVDRIRLSLTRKVKAGLE